MGNCNHAATYIWAFPVEVTLILREVQNVWFIQLRKVRAVDQLGFFQTMGILIILIQVDYFIPWRK